MKFQPRRAAILAGKSLASASAAFGIAALVHTHSFNNQEPEDYFATEKSDEVTRYTHIRETAREQENFFTSTRLYHEEIIGKVHALGGYKAIGTREVERNFLMGFEIAAQEVSELKVLWPFGDMEALTAMSPELFGEAKALHDAAEQAMEWRGLVGYGKWYQDVYDNADQLKADFIEKFTSRENALSLQQKAKQDQNGDVQSLLGIDPSTIVMEKYQDTEITTTYRRRSCRMRPNIIGRSIINTLDCPPRYRDTDRETVIKERLPADIQTRLDEARQAAKTRYEGITQEIQDYDNVFKVQEKWPKILEARIAFDAFNQTHGSVEDAQDQVYKMIDAALETMAARFEAGYGVQGVNLPPEPDSQ